MTPFSSFLIREEFRSGNMILTNEREHFGTHGAYMEDFGVYIHLNELNARTVSATKSLSIAAMTVNIARSATIRLGVYRRAGLSSALRKKRKRSPLNSSRAWNRAIIWITGRRLPNMLNRYPSNKVHTKINLGALLNSHNVTRTALAEAAEISHTTVTSACRGERIMLEKAEKISKALRMELDQLFQIEQNSSPLSNKTIKEYHRFIRVVLGQAEREMLVPYNAAAKAVPPKSKSPDPNYFQPKEITEILQALEEEPLKWQLISHLLLVTGCRRGEVMGLKWSKIDLDECRVKIDTNLLYSKARGIYEGPTKTENTRYLKLPEETIALLRRYRASQNQLRLVNGDRWHDTDFVFTRDDGQPMNPCSITAWLDHFSKRHGLRHINPHAFRHSVASILIAHGTDVVTVSKQLGHTKPSTTDNFYAHLIEEEKSKASECIAEVMLRQSTRKAAR